MNTLDFIYNEIPNSRGNIDKCIKITPNEICTIVMRYHRMKSNDLPTSNVMDMFTADQMEEAWWDGENSDCSGDKFDINNYEKTATN